jgi:hypothetical protein
MVKVAYTVGRFQPPTIGHKALIQAVKDAAGDGGQAYVFVSSTMTPKAKNPLTSAQKMSILKHMFPAGVTFVDTQECKDKGEPCGGAIAAFYWLLGKDHKKEDITLVVGDDRKPEFGPGADIWKRKEEKDFYSPGDFKFLKSADRNPDLEVKDAANMSGTKARQYVKDGRKDDFYIAVGYDGAANKAAADAVYDVIKGMKKGGRSGGTKKNLETTFGADVEFTYPKRKTRRNKASGRALYRRGSQSRSGSLKTNRSSYALRGY